MKIRTNKSIKISLRIMLLAVAFCLPVSAQAMQALGSRVSGTAMRAARLSTQIAGRAVRPAMQTPQRMFSSFAPTAPVRSVSKFGKAVLGGGIGMCGSIALAQEEAAKAPAEKNAEIVAKLLAIDQQRRDIIVALAQGGNPELAKKLQELDAQEQQLRQNLLEQVKELSKEKKELEEDKRSLKYRLAHNNVDWMGAVVALAALGYGFGMEAGKQEGYTKGYNKGSRDMRQQLAPPPAYGRQQ